MIKIYSFLFILQLVFSFESKNSLKDHHRLSKRTLIFPPTSPTRVQFIYGIGIPLEDLDVESLTTGYVLKAEYFLPTKAEEFRPTQLTPQDIGYFGNKRDLSEYHRKKATTEAWDDNLKISDTAEHTKRSELSKYRWAVYESFEILLRRFLVFPPSAPTRYQFIVGFGVPAELDYEAVVTGYVFKAEYYLPSNSTQLYILNPSGNPINIDDSYKAKNESLIDVVGRKFVKKREKPFFPELRWSLYSVFHSLLERAGFDGQACLLRSICEIGAIPFHSNGGLMAELIHILMSPSTSHDVIEKHKHNQFLKAEVLGKQGAPCELIFKECKTSVLQKFTLIRDLFDFLG